VREREPIAKISARYPVGNPSICGMIVALHMQRLPGAGTCPTDFARFALFLKQHVTCDRRAASTSLPDPHQR